jgi:hypothetical protein
VHTYASLLAMGAMLAQNPTSKYDQLIVYASKLFNKANIIILLLKKKP